MTFMAWPGIEQFYNIRKYTSSHPEILNGQSVVQYKCKVKLHGTAAAIQIHKDGTIVCQSRESIITPEKDNAGFARWVKENEAVWKSDEARRDVIIYGEWIGKGIQKGVAVSEIPKKSFAVFAARPLNDGLPLEDFLWIAPTILEDLVKGIPDTYVLPWYARPQMHGSDTNCEVYLDIDWSKSAEELTKQTDQINEWVAAIEANDPWVESTFGNKGTGEGIVFYPVSMKHLGAANFSNLVFKAKGEAHKNIATAKPAQVDPEVAASVDAFVDMVLTEARLEQGANKVANDTMWALGYEMSLIGKFIAWVDADVRKEAADELEASGLTYDQIKRQLQTKTRQWYLTKAK